MILEKCLFQKIIGIEKAHLPKEKCSCNNAIRPINSVYSALVKTSVENLPNAAQCHFVGEIPESATCLATNNCQSTIDVLVLIPQDLQKGYNISLDVYNRVHAAMISVNLALANSLVNNVQVRYKVKPFTFTYTKFQNGDPNISADIANLATTSASLRNLYYADLVVMPTTVVYPDYAGLSNGSGIPCPSSPCASSIVTLDFALAPRWTFAHEIAHLFGAGHNRTTNCSTGGVCGDYNSSTCEHGLVFTDGLNTERRTIMARMLPSETAAGSTRELNYSNPNVFINGTSTGNTNTNNAVVISNNACAVSNYRSSWTAKMLAPANSFCIGDPIQINSYVAAANPGLLGQAPFSYNWDVACNVDFVGAISGGHQSSMYLTSVPCSSTFWVRLVVTSDDGETITHIQKFSLVQCIGGPSGGDRSIVPNALDEFSALKLFPNPAQSSIQIEISDLENLSWDASISNTLGQVVWKKRTDSNQLQVSLNSFDPGVYWVTAHLGDRVLVQSFIVQN